MSWFASNLNDSFSSLKGQIVSLTKDVLEVEEEESQAAAEAQSSFVAGASDFIKKIEILQSEKADLESRLQATELESRRKIATLEKKLSLTEDEFKAFKEHAKEWNWDARDGEEKDVKSKKKQPVLEAQLSTAERDGVVEKLQSELKLLLDKFKETENENKRLHSGMQELDSQHQLALDILCRKKNQQEKELTVSNESLAKAEATIVELQSLVQPKQPPSRPSDDGDLKLSSLSNLMSQNKQLIIEMKNLKCKKYLPIDSTVERDMSCKEDITTQLQLQLEESNLLIQQLTDAKLTAEGEIVSFANNLEESINRLSIELSAKTTDSQSSTGDVDANMEKQVSMDQLKKYAEHIELTNMRNEAVIEQLHSDNETLRQKYHDEIDRRQVTSNQVSDPSKRSRVHVGGNDSVNEQAIRCLEELMGSCNLNTMEELPLAIREKDSEIACLRCEMDKLQEDLEALLSEKLELEGECEELRDQLEELQYGKREEPEGSIARTLTTIEEEESEPTEDLTRAQSEASRSDEPTAKKDRVSQYKLEIASLNDKCHELQRTIVNLKSNNAQLDSATVGSPQKYDPSSSVSSISNDDSSASPTSATTQFEASVMLSLKQLTEMNLLRSQVIFKDDQIDELRETIFDIGQLFGVKEYNLRETFCAAKREVFKVSDTPKKGVEATDDTTGGDHLPATLQPPTTSQRETELNTFLQKSLNARRKELFEFRLNKAHFCYVKEQELLESVSKLEHLMDFEDERKRENLLFSKTHQDLKIKFESSEARIDALNQTVSELEAGKAQLILNYENSLTARNEECFQKNELIMQLKHELTDLSSCAAQKDAASQQKLVECTETIARLEADGDQLRTDNASLRRREEEREAVVHEQQSQLTKEKADAVERFSTVNQNLMDGSLEEMDYAKLKEEKETVYQSFISVSADLEELKKSSEQRELSNTEMQSTVLQLNNCLDTKTKELLDATENILKLEQDARRQQLINEESDFARFAQILHLNDDIGTKKKELFDANQTISQLMQEASQQQLISDATQNHILQLTNSSEAKARELSEANDTIARLQQEFAQQQVINEETKNQIVDLQTFLETKQKELLEANESVSKLTLASEQQQLLSNDETDSKILHLSNSLETKVKELLEVNENLARLKQDSAHQTLMHAETEDKNLHLSNCLEMKTKELIAAKESISKLQQDATQQQLFNDETKGMTSQLTSSLEAKSNELMQANEIISKNQSEFKRLEEVMINLMNQNEQLMTANAAFNAQYEAVSKELVSSQEKEKKEKHLQAECERLKQHLVSIEESYTNDLLQAEQRESALKQTIAKLHDKMASHSNLYSSNNIKNADKVETLQENLKNAVLRRDEALQKLEICEERAIENEESLRSLNQVLLDFQKSYNKDVREATEKERREMEKERQKSGELQHQINALQRKIDDLECTSSAAQELRSEIVTKQASIIALQSQVSAMEKEVKSSQNQVQMLQSSKDVKVEKNLVRNLLVGYFASPADKQQEVLHVIAQTLDFSPSERARTGLDTNPNSWMTSLANFLAPPPSTMRVTSKVDLLDHSSLSQRFIRFLEEESVVRPQVKLPAIEMAEEASQKAQKKAQSRANDPFSAGGTMQTFSPLIDTPLSDAQSVVLQPVNNQEERTDGPPQLSEEKYLKNLLSDDGNSTQNS